MTRIVKLYASVADSPRTSLSFRDFVRLVEAFGFVEVRQRGSHRCFRRPDLADMLVIQPRGADAKPYQVEAFLGIVATRGLKLDDQ